MSSSGKCVSPTAAGANVAVRAAAAAAVLLAAAQGASGRLYLGPEQVVQAGGVNLQVPGYSIPCFADWDSDGRPDLVVGEGGGGYDPYVRVYLNEGTAADPQFSSYSYVSHSGGSAVTYVGPDCPLCACMGLFPRVVYWDADARKDLLIGQLDGTVRVYLNDGTEQDPTFDAGQFLQMGQPGLKTDIDVGIRATPIAVDWNNDLRKDLVVGAWDGRVHVFLNEGTDTEPDFRTRTFAQAGGSDLYVDQDRASPVVMDLTGDGKKDLLTGNTEGQVLLYANVGADAAPVFDPAYTFVAADGTPIDLPGTPRSRPFVCDWTADGLPDLLVGAGDGWVRLYLGRRIPGDASLDDAVDIQDFSILKAHFGQDPAEWGDGNFNDDTVVDGQDFSILKAHFGEHAPEPGAAVLLLMVLPWLIRRRCGRCQ